MFSKSVVIVETGASHAACGQFRAGRGGRWRLESHATEAFVCGPAAREGEWLEKTEAALQSVRSRFGGAGPVGLVLPPHLLLLKFIRTPRVAAPQREQIVRFEAGRTIPFALSDVVWGATLVGETETACTVMLCAARLDAIEPLCAVVESAGFWPAWLLPGPLATLAAAGLNPVAWEPGAVLAHVGARSTTLLFWVNGGVHLRSFLLGGNTVTAQVAKSQGIDFAEAEALKLSGLEREVSEPAAAVLAARLAQEITRSALSFQCETDAVAPRRIVLAGGGARLPDLDGQVARRLNLPVERFDPRASLPGGGGAAAAVGRDREPDLTDLIGAGILHLSGDRRTINLLPPRLRAHADRQRRQPWFAVAAALGLASLAPPLVHYRAMAEDLRRQNQVIERDLVRLRRDEARLGVNRKRLDEVRRRLAVLDALQDRRFAWLSMLADLQRRLDDVGDVWLDQMKVAPASGPGRGPGGSLPPLRLGVSGRMIERSRSGANADGTTNQRVKALLESVAESPFIAGLDGATFDNSQPGVLRFSFILTPEAAHPL